MIIGISGYIGSGKSTVAEIMQRELERANQKQRWDMVNFAGKLKQVVAILLNCSVADLENQEFKKKELGEEWNRTIQHARDWLSMKFDTSVEGKDDEEIRTWANNAGFKWERTVREVLQEVGTDLFRVHFHPNTWVIATMNTYNHRSDNWLIPDMRFMNELNSVKIFGGLVVRINRGPKTSNHSSEVSLDKYQYWDWVFDNTGSLENLEKQVIDFLTHFKLI